MSNTYHHGDKAKRRKFGEGKVRWYQACPHGWRNTMMTRPQRAEVRTLLNQVLKLVDYEDAPLFPLGKKPHVYYY